MLLTISTTHQPATDLGYLLHKNPERVQTFPLTFGAAHVFYPEATAERCTAALLLDVDPVGLVRRRGAAGGAAALAQYVSDRPYAASSFLSVAVGEVYGSALSGVSRERPALAETALPLEARLTAMPCRGGADLLRRLFEPLGYTVETEAHGLDPHFPEWGESPYFTLTLRAEVRLRDLLLHLTVLIPVLDNAKHYWVGDDEVEKLLRRGEGWLARQPERALIARRYLKRRQPLIRAALDRLRDEEGTEDRDQGTGDGNEEAVDGAIAEPEERVSLNQQRLGTVLAALKASGARRVLDLGCGEGRLLKALLDEPQFEEIVGLDVSARALAVAADRLRVEQMPERRRERIKLLHGSLTYRDARLAGYDAAASHDLRRHRLRLRRQAHRPPLPRKRSRRHPRRPRLLRARPPLPDEHRRTPPLHAGHGEGAGG